MAHATDHMETLAMGDQERFEVGCKVAGSILTAEWLLLAVGVIFFRGSLATMFCGVR